MLEALKIDLLSTHANLGLSYISGFAGRFGPSLQQAQKCLEIDEDCPFAHMHAANAYWGLDQPLKALESSQESLRHALTAPFFWAHSGEPKRRRVRARRRKQL